MSASHHVTDSRIVLPDIHVPYHDTRALAAIEHYMAWRQSRTSRVRKLDGWIQLGDFGDFDSVSRHNVGRRKLQEGLRVAADFASCNEVLDRHQNILGERASYSLIEGNHEDRLSRYAEEHPEIDGLLTVPKGLNLDTRGIQWYPFWSRGHRGGILRVGKAQFGHGRKTSGFHAKWHAISYGANFFYGHCFDTATELLTRYGWKRYDELLDTDRAATVTPDGTVEYQRIVSRTVYEAGVYPELRRFIGQHVDAFVTADHGLVDWYRGHYSRYKACEYRDKVVRTWRCAGTNAEPGIPYTDDEIRLCVWIAADGSLENARYAQTAVRWNLKKARKLSRLTALLGRLGISFTCSKPTANGSRRIYVGDIGRVASLFDWHDKHLPSVLVQCSAAQGCVVLHEYAHTDGCWTSHNSIQLSSAKPSEIDMLQHIAVTSGWRANKRGRTLSVCSRATSEVRTEKTDAGSQEYAGPVWCVSVPNGTLIVRRNGKAYITQNTHDTQSHTHPFVGENRVVAAESLGCLCNLNRDWMQGSPDKWQHAFAAFNWLRDGSFGYSLVRIFNGRFISPEGEVFTHRGRVVSA